MSASENERLALAVLEMVKEKKAEIKILTCELMALADNPENSVKIKQNIQAIVNAVSSVSNSSSTGISSNAKAVLTLMRLSEDHENHFQSTVRRGIEDFCVVANSWNPIDYDFSKKGIKINLKNLSFGVNINK